MCGFCETEIKELFKNNYGRDLKFITPYVKSGILLPETKLVVDAGIDSVILANVTVQRISQSLIGNLDLLFKAPNFKNELEADVQDSTLSYYFESAMVESFQANYTGTDAAGSRLASYHIVGYKIILA